MPIARARPRKWPPQVENLTYRYVNGGLSDSTRDVIYVSSTTGRAESIADIHPTHAKNALAKIVRELTEGKMAYIDEAGIIRFT